MKGSAKALTTGSPGPPLFQLCSGAHERALPPHIAYPGNKTTAATPCPSVMSTSNDTGTTSPTTAASTTQTRPWATCPHRPRIRTFGSPISDHNCLASPLPTGQKLWDAHPPQSPKPSAKGRTTLNTEEPLPVGTRGCGALNFVFHWGPVIPVVFVFYDSGGPPHQLQAMSNLRLSNPKSSTWPEWAWCLTHTSATQPCRGTDN